MGPTGSKGEGLCGRQKTEDRLQSLRDSLDKEVKHTGRFIGKGPDKQAKTCPLSGAGGVHPRCAGWGLSTRAHKQESWGRSGQKGGEGMSALGEIHNMELPYFIF